MTIIQNYSLVSLAEPDVAARRLGPAHEEEPPGQEDAEPGDDVDVRVPEPRRVRREEEGPEEEARRPPPKDTSE